MSYLDNLWFTPARQGVMKVVLNQFSDLFMRFDLPETVVNSTCMYGDKLFVATDTGLIVLDDNGQVSNGPLTRAATVGGVDLEADDLITLLQGSRIRSIIRDSQNQLWFSLWRSHGLLRYAHGEVTVFMQADGTHLDLYPKQNMGTILQRASAALMLSLLYCTSTPSICFCPAPRQGSGLWFALLMLSQPPFYGVALTHMAVSVTRLGLLASIDRQKRIDRLIYILCALAFAVSTFVVLRAELAIFLSGGGAA